MSYKYITKHNAPAYTKARRGKGDIQGITIHHWDKLENRPTFEGTIAWLTRPGAVTSAHYVVEAGRVACLVSPKNIAWGNGNMESNRVRIVIECNPRASAEDYETVAELCAELEKAYGPLGYNEHRNIKATSCPGLWSSAKVRALARGSKAVASSAYYTIKAGDTLGKLAARFKTTVSKLAKLNKLPDPDEIRAGQKIKTK